MSDVMELVGFMLALFGGAALLIAVIIVAVYTTTDPPTCYSRGKKMGIEVNWSFWPGCMGRVQNQWLPWDGIIPVERDGKIVFVPRPQPIIVTK